MLQLYRETVSSKRLNPFVNAADAVVVCFGVRSDAVVSVCCIYTWPSCCVVWCRKGCWCYAHRVFIYLTTLFAPSFAKLLLPVIGDVK